ncbi:MAG: ArsB/NhaD family transporter [Rhodospirillales bacterium]|nr:ArsB/NhaD family transporter [Rhodospirillales bacterium]
MEPDAAAPIHLLFGLNPMWTATAVLVATYAVIMSEKVNRAIVALLGATLLILLGIMSQEAAVRGVDFNTIGLLIGMMVIVAITKRCGVFQFLAIWAARRARANPAGIMIMLQIITAVVSAFLDNVTTVLLVVPVTMVITEELGVSPYPFLVSQVFASNIGGTATLIGDPPNILIGSLVGLTFNQFILNLTPVIIVIQATACLLFHLLWGRRLHATEQARARIMRFDAGAAISDRRLLVQSLSVIAIVIAGFVFAHSFGIQPATTALFGAALLMLLYCFGQPAEEQSERVQSIFNEVEWITIFFFVGLFIVVGGVEETGLLKLAAEKLVAATGGNLGTTTIAILWSSAVLSAVIDNIPFVATMIPLIHNMAPSFGGPEGLMPLWWALSLGACLGGNGTLVGASANLTVAGLAERAGQPIRFVPYMKIAFPTMLATVAIANVYLVLRYLP